MNAYPSGSVVVCRFAITLRPLSDIGPGSELQSFLDGLGLPAGVGVTPAVVLFDYRAPGEPVVTLTAASTPAIATDASGAFHVALPAIAHGRWEYRGYGQDASGSPVAATPKISFTVTPF